MTDPNNDLIWTQTPLRKSLKKLNEKHTPLILPNDTCFALLFHICLQRSISLLAKEASIKFVRDSLNLFVSKGGNSKSSRI